MGQQGKFLLNKVPENMVWKYNLVNKFNKNNLYLNSRIISQIITFLLKKDLYLLYFLKKKKKFYKLKKINEFLKLVVYLKKKIRNFMRKILYSQIRVTRFGDWHIINLIIFTTYKSKNKLIRKNDESYFRLKHFYHYLTPMINNFKCIQDDWKDWLTSLLVLLTTVYTRTSCLSSLLFF